MSKAGAARRGRKPGGDRASSRPRGAVVRAWKPPRRHAMARAGLARQRLAQRYAVERVEQVELYEADYRQVAAGWAGSKPPLRILAEGDSWFDYPALLGNGIVTRLRPRLRVPILNLAAAGDEVRAMAGLAQRRTLERVLREAPQPFDALLFSGGGNDVAGDPLCMWIKPYDPGKPPEWHIDHGRFAAALALVRAGYEDLISLRDQVSAGTRLFLHQYDFAIPNGKGMLFLGPWLEPALKYRGVPTLALRRAIVREMLLLFAAELDDIAAKHPRVTVVRTQGTLDPHPDWWDNELHPNARGFNAFADRFHAALRAAFPGQVA